MVLNCNAGKHGFPSELSDSQVLNLLLSNADHYENGEERRLFYVAMTRAKHQVYFFTNKFSPSKFITELEPTKENSTRIKCPDCKTAEIVLKKTGIAKSGKTYHFYGCTNYQYGCDYTTTQWDN